MSHRSIFAVVFAVCVVALTTAIAQRVRLLVPDNDFRAINSEVSGELELDYVRHITAYSRNQPSREYHMAAEWLVQQAKQANLSDVHIEKYPADGKTWYYMWPSSPAWEVDSAVLWIVEPREERLASYAEIPASVAINSGTCDVKAPLVYVGDGISPADYERVNVKNAAVLANGPIGQVAALAVDRYGAAGVVVINMRYADDEPDIVSGLRVTTKKATFGFGLSHRRGEELKNRVLRGEKIVVRAVVKAQTEPSFYENVVATIPGTDLADQEIWLTAHLCHPRPSANDNASGSASILEAGRALKVLIDQGKLAKPKRTIRFLWIPEMSGSIAYLATHPDIAKRAIAGINLDMVGQYLNKNNATFFLRLTPHSRPHYLNDVIANVVEYLGDTNVEGFREGLELPVYSLSGSRDAFRYRIWAYAGGSDQVMYNDGLIGIPFAAFTIWPDHYYHTSGDKPEMLDPTQLKRSAVLAAATAAFLSDDAPEKAQRLAGEVYANARVRISSEIKRCFDYLEAAKPSALPTAYKEALNFVDHAYRRDVTSLEGVQTYSNRDAAVKAYVVALAGTLKGQQPQTIKEIESHYLALCKLAKVTPQAAVLSEDERVASRLIPVRNAALKGPVDPVGASAFLQEKLRGTSAQMELAVMRQDRRMPYEILNFIDGKRSLLEIRNAVSAEYSPVPIAWVWEYVELLAKAGVVELPKPTGALVKY
jgi:hypothetical protein